MITPDLVGLLEQIVPHGVRTGSFTEPQERVRRNVETRRPLVVTKLALGEVENDGASRIETGYHRRPFERQKALSCATV